MQIQAASRTRGISAPDFDAPCRMTTVAIYALIYSVYSYAILPSHAPLQELKVIWIGVSIYLCVELLIKYPQVIAYCFPITVLPTAPKNEGSKPHDRSDANRFGNRAR